MLCRLSEQLVYMRCSPSPLSIRELENNVSPSLQNLFHSLYRNLFVYALARAIFIHRDVFDYAVAEQPQFGLCSHRVHFHEPHLLAG